MDHSVSQFHIFDWFKNRKFNSPLTPLFIEFQCFIFGVLWAREPSSFSVQLIVLFLASPQTFRGEETAREDKECLCRRLGAITYCFRGSSTGFSGSRIISLIWGSGFRILKHNRGEILDESLCERWDAKNNPLDHGIVQNFGSGLWDWKASLGTLILYRSTIHFSNHFLSIAVFQNTVHSLLLYMYLVHVLSLLCRQWSAIYSPCFTLSAG